MTSRRSLRSIALATTQAVVVVMLLAAVSLGADPTPSPSPLPQVVLESGDLRSEGEGPGLVGNPILILGGVVILGLATAFLTTLVLRLTRRA